MVSDWRTDEEDGSEIPISSHMCSKDEIRELAPPARDAEGQIAQELAAEAPTLHCIDWVNHASDLSIQGSYSTDRYRSVTLTLAPCNYVPEGHEEFYPISEECIKDEKA